MQHWDYLFCWTVSLQYDLWAFQGNRSKIKICFQLKEQPNRGTWLVQSVRCPTLDFGSGHGLKVMRLNPMSWLCTGLGARLRFSLSFSSSLLLHSLSKTSKQHKPLQKLEEQGQFYYWIHFTLQCDVPHRQPTKGIAKTREISASYIAKQLGRIPYIFSR